jgi:hypothetical protein
VRDHMVEIAPVQSGRPRRAMCALSVVRRLGEGRSAHGRQPTLKTSPFETHPAACAPAGDRGGALPPPPGRAISLAKCEKRRIIEAVPRLKQYQADGLMERSSRTNGSIANYSSGLVTKCCLRFRRPLSSRLRWWRVAVDAVQPKYFSITAASNAFSSSSLRFPTRAWTPPLIRRKASRRTGSKWAPRPRSRISQASSKDSAGL